MTEILTESFCERCGSRYTFESAVPKDRLRRVKVLSRGLKTFVLDDKTSFDEALAAARSDTDREATSSQLDAFHKTFNFCMQCRQYTCPNCWNEAEGRCLTCAPMSHAPAQAAVQDLQPATGLALPTASSNRLPGPAGSGGMPVADLDTLLANGANGHAPDVAADAFDPIARLDALSMVAAPVDEPVVDAAPAVEPVVPPVEPVEASTVPLAEPVAAESWPAEEALEPVGEAVIAEPVAEPLIQPEPVIEAVAAEPEPVVAEPVVEPEPVVEALVAEPVIEPEHVIEPLDELVFETTDDVTPIPPEIEMDEVSLDLGSAEEPVAAPPILTDTETDERAAAAAIATGALFASMRPGESLDDAIDAYERDEPAAVVETEAVVAEPVIEPVVEPEPVIEPEPEPVAVVPEPVVEPEPEPVAAAPEPESEPVAAAPEPVVEPEPVAVVPKPEPEPVAAAPEPEPEPVVAPSRPAVDIVEQPTWTIVAPESAPTNGAPVVMPPAAIPASPATPPAATTEPAWPATPEWPARQTSPGLPNLGRPAVPTGGVDALWAASDREVTTAPAGDRQVTGVQSCVSCGLSLSATARFCRRCGTAQR